MHWEMFWKEWKTTLKWYMRHVVIFPAYCILHVGTLLSFPKLIPLPLLYVGLPWGGGETPDSGLHAHIRFWEPFTIVVILYLFLCKSRILELLLLMHHILYPDTRLYHMLGRRGIRLVMYLSSFTFGLWISGVTTRLVGMLTLTLIV